MTADVISNETFVNKEGQSSQNFQMAELAKIPRLASPKKKWKLWVLCPSPYPIYLLMCVFRDTFYNKLVNMNKCVPEFCDLLWQIG